MFKLRTNLTIKLKSERLSSDMTIEKGTSVTDVIEGLQTYLPKVFTVMLLRPDYVTNNYGQDTFTESVEAADAKQAIELVKYSCAEADHRTQEYGYEEDDYNEYCADLHVLACMKGNVEFIR